MAYNGKGLYPGGAYNRIRKKVCQNKVHCKAVLIRLHFIFSGF